jgi:hypothetical protein
MQAQAHLVVMRAKRRDRIAVDRGCRRCLGKWTTIRPPEAEGPVRAPRDLIALLVDGAMMPTALCRAPDYAE